MQQTVTLDLDLQNANHSMRFVAHLAASGWIPGQLPAGGRIAPNRQLVELRIPRRTIRLRVSIYKVGHRGETHRLDERRIEITTTRSSGLTPLRNWADVVLGYDPETNAYVGLDPRRLELGGETHNASSFVDPAALVSASPSRLLIRPHESESLGLEYQAIFRPPRLSEYLFNYEPVHEGRYRGDGLLSGPMGHARATTLWTLPRSACRGAELVLSRSRSGSARRRAISSAVVEAYERGGVVELPELTPDDLEQVLQKCKEVGDAGESFVYQRERKRLLRTRMSHLVGDMDWISQRAVGKGYDIKSFNSDESPKYIEVKSTIATGRTFFMSDTEWKTATRLRGSYWIYRVVNALDRPRISAMLQDPFGAEGTNDIERVPDGWRVTLRSH
jgi:hypothetical protein